MNESIDGGGVIHDRMRSAGLTFRNRNNRMGLRKREIDRSIDIDLIIVSEGQM
jgi:hypothetical protein